MGGYQRGTAGFSRLLIAMFCAGVATFAQLYSPQAILPMISNHLQVDPAQAALLVSAATAGLALSVIGWSWAADRLGRVRTMLIAISIASVAGLVFMVAASFAVMVILRFVEGAALGGVAGVAVAYITEETHPTSMVAAAGLYVSGTSIGGLSGRLVSAPVAEFTGSWRAGIAAVMAVAILAAVAFAVLVPRSARFAPDRISIATVFKRSLLHLRNRRLLAVYVQGFALMGCFVTVYNYLGFHLQAEPFKLSATISSFLFLSYLAGTWSSAQAARLTNRLGRLRVMIGCLGLMIAGLLISLVPSVVVIIMGLVILTIGFFGGHAIASVLSGSLAPSGRAQSTALYTMAYYLGSSVMGWFGGVVLHTAGWVGIVMFCTLVVGVAIAVAALAARKPHTSDG